MFQRLSQKESLRIAWKRVLSNNGAPGLDNITVQKFRHNAEAEIEKLSQDLKKNRYTPIGLREYCIPKKDGSIRRLLVPSVRDRVLQTNVHMHLTQSLDRLMSEASYGYRPGRGVNDAIKSVNHFINAGWTNIFDADIKNYFSNIRHEILIQDLSWFVSDSKTLNLIISWLSQFSKNGIGIAQGSPVSPIFANIYLHPLDKLLIAKGFRVVRYADDFLVLMKNRSDMPLARRTAKEVLHSRKLKLNRRKTFMRKPGASFYFLGQEVRIPRETSIGR